MRVGGSSRRLNKEGERWCGPQHRLPNTSLIAGPWRTSAPWRAHGLVEILRKALEAGADVNEAGAEDGVTPLMLAVNSQDTGLLQQLLRAGAAVATTNREQWTALHVAGSHSCRAVACITVGAVWDRTIAWITAHALRAVLAHYEWRCTLLTHAERRVCWALGRSRVHAIRSCIFATATGVFFEHAASTIHVICLCACRL